MNIIYVYMREYNICIYRYSSKLNNETLSVCFIKIRNIRNKSRSKVRMLYKNPELFHFYITWRKVFIWSFILISWFQSHRHLYLIHISKSYEYSNPDLIFLQINNKNKSLLELLRIDTASRNIFLNQIRNIFAMYL